MKALSRAVLLRGHKLGRFHIDEGTERLGVFSVGRVLSAGLIAFDRGNCKVRYFIGWISLKALWDDAISPAETELGLNMDDLKSLSSSLRISKPVFKLGDDSNPAVLIMLSYLHDLHHTLEFA